MRALNVIGLLIVLSRRSWSPFLFLISCSAAFAASCQYLSPAALATSADGKTLFVACATGNRVLCFDVAERKTFTLTADLFHQDGRGEIPSVAMPASPSGLAISPDGEQLFVTCGGRNGQFHCRLSRLAQTRAQSFSGSWPAFRGGQARRKDFPTSRLCGLSCARTVHRSSPA